MKHRKEFQQSLEYYTATGRIKHTASSSEIENNHNVSLLYRWAYQVRVVGYLLDMEFLVTSPIFPIITTHVCVFDLFWLYYSF